MENKLPAKLKNEIGKRIKALRLANNMNLEDLAINSNLKSRSTISEIEAGKHIPSLTNIYFIARALHTTVAELLKGTKLEEEGVTADDSAPPNDSNDAQF